MKKAVINVQSMDNACFMWSVMAVLYPAKQHVGRTKSSALYDGSEFQWHRVSDDSKEHRKIRTSEQRVD